MMDRLEHRKVGASTWLSTRSRSGRLVDRAGSGSVWHILKALALLLVPCLALSGTCWCHFQLCLALVGVSSGCPGMSCSGSVLACPALALFWRVLPVAALPLVCVLWLYLQCVWVWVWVGDSGCLAEAPVMMVPGRCCW